MKRKFLTASLVCFPIFLGSCNSDMASGKLKLVIVGPTSAPILVINQTKSVKIFDGIVSGSMTFNNISQNSIIRIIASPVANFDAPSYMDVQVSKDTNVNIVYVAPL